MIPNKKIVDKYRKATRLTAQKKTILACLRHFEPIHPTSQMVFQVVKKEIPTISLGTVYRNLNSLKEAGFIEEITIPDEPSRFDGRVDAHFHFRCKCCKELFDIENPKLFRSVKRFLKESGFLVQRSSLMYSGLCKKCQGHKKNDTLICSAHGKIKSKIHQRDSFCKICDFQEECMYHTIK